jgi:hypothetical protein
MFEVVSAFLLGDFVEGFADASPESLLNSPTTLFRSGV